MIRFLSTLITISSFCCYGQTAYNQNILPLGEQEALMANTGTGGLASTGAVYYNPAALTMSSQNRFSFSGNAYLRYRFKAQPVARIQGEDLNFKGEGYQTIPSSAIMTRVKDKWHLAFSILIPMQFNNEGKQAYTLSTMDVDVIQNYQESYLMAGVTAARDLGNGWSAGASLYGQSYSLLSTLSVNGTSIQVPGEGLQLDTRKKFNTISLLLITGIQKRLEKINLGARLVIPSVYITGKGDYYSYSFNNVGVAPSAIEETDVSDSKTNFRNPMEIRLGATYFPNEKWIFALDGSYGYALKYDLYESAEVSSTQDLNAAYRFSTGATYLYKEKTKIYAGASYTPTRLSGLIENFNQDFLGLFGGASRKTGKAETSVGFFFNLNNTSQQLPLGDGSGKRSYQYLGVVVGTAAALD